MKGLFLRIFDYLEKRRWLMWLAAGVVVAVCALLISLMRIDEDISSFLPLDNETRRKTELYGQFSGAEKIVVLFESINGEKERVKDAIDSFDVRYREMGISVKLTSFIDLYDYVDALEEFYGNMPYYLTEEDYERMESLLSQPGYVDSLMGENRRNLLMPMPEYAMVSVRNDPLHLFQPVVRRLMQQIPYGGSFTVDDGFMITKDGRIGIAWLESPYGASETQCNGLLIDSLRNICSKVKVEGVDVRLTGAPVIAVENSRCIKHDSLVAGIVALIIIVVLLWLVLRSVKSMLLIVLTVGMGWLFALGAVGALFGSVSMIVIGMGSVLTGIAVNYPLHVVMHRNYTDNLRENLGELVSPLVIGNITTVGAFCALLPLEADAMRQLGVFAAALLVGTILFSVIILPHLLPSERRESMHLLRFMPALGRKGSVISVCVITAITVLMSLFIPSTSFNTNLSDINYMTVEQRSDIARLTSMTKQQEVTHTLYVIQAGGNWDDRCLSAEKAEKVLDAFGNKELVNDIMSPTDFVPSRKTQAERIARWEEFIDKHKRQIEKELNLGQRRCGFSEDAFAPFNEMKQRKYDVRDSATFINVASVFMPDKVRNGNICARCQVSVADEKALIESLEKCGIAFTMEQNNAAIAETLSGEFDYLGLICSIIVLLFLWISFRNVRLALLAFLPMAISWVWILGIMGLMGIQFNIVNIILATFIFGQGDDYTIFMVEGVVHEHNTGQSILPQYRTEIVMSAIIMLVGIGTLVISHHPAMHSLGTVTLIGMTVVVIMAYLLPQAIFNICLTIKNKNK